MQSALLPFIFTISFLWITVSTVSHGKVFIGQPNITCGPSSITVTFETRKPFDGRIFVKGKRKETGCFNSTLGTTHPSLQVHFGNCDFKRLSVPKGKMARLEVIISTHPLFISEQDQLVVAQCLYPEGFRTVGEMMRAREIETFQEKTVQMEPPKCKYEVLEGGVNGTIVHKAALGMEVFHKWSCETKMTNMYCLNVHSCSLQNKKEAVQTVDSNGCATNRKLLSSIEYINDLTAVVQSNIYTFSDFKEIFYECQVTLNLKHRGKCHRTACPHSGVEHRQQITNIDPYSIVDDSGLQQANGFSTTTSSTPTPIKVFRMNNRRTYEQRQKIAPDTYSTTTGSPLITVLERGGYAKDSEYGRNTDNYPEKQQDTGSTVIFTTIATPRRTSTTRATSTSTTRTTAPSTSTVPPTLIPQNLLLTAYEDVFSPTFNRQPFMNSQYYIGRTNDREPPRSHNYRKFEKLATTTVPSGPPGHVPPEWTTTTADESTVTFPTLRGKLVYTRRTTPQPYSKETINEHTTVPITTTMASKRNHHRQTSSTHSSGIGGSNVQYPTKYPTLVQDYQLSAEFRSPIYSTPSSYSQKLQQQRQPYALQRSDFGSYYGTTANIEGVTKSTVSVTVPRNTLQYLGSRHIHTTTALPFSRRLPNDNSKSLRVEPSLEELFPFFSDAFANQNRQRRPKESENVEIVSELHDEVREFEQRQPAFSSQYWNGARRMKWSSSETSNFDAGKSSPIIDLTVESIDSVKSAREIDSAKSSFRHSSQKNQEKTTSESSIDFEYASDEDDLNPNYDKEENVEEELRKMLHRKICESVSKKRRRSSDNYYH